MDFIGFDPFAENEPAAEAAGYFGGKVATYLIFDTAFAT